MRNKIPWWLRIILKVILSRLPINYSSWRRMKLFQHGDMNNSEYAIKVFDKHIDLAKLRGRLKGLNLLELGPGDNLATALIAHANGARATLVDVDHFASFDKKNYESLIKEVASKFYYSKSPSLISQESFLLDVNGRYMTNGLESLRSLPSSSYDFIFSQAVLEHVKKNEFRETVRELHRISKSGSLSSHRVDLRDHLGGNLNNLRFTESVWESNIFTRSGFYTNRLRYSSVQSIFLEEGFEILHVNLNRWSNLPIQVEKIDSSISYNDISELSIYSFDILATPKISP